LLTRCGYGGWGYGPGYYDDGIGPGLLGLGVGLTTGYGGVYCSPFEDDSSYCGSSYAAMSAAIAQNPQPKGSPAQTKSHAPAGCKLVGTVKGTKLWAGDCTDAAGLRSSEPAAPPLPEQAGNAIPPGQKQ
jgi:hypothetical protein